MERNVYFVSDLHFFHNNIMKFTKRPFSSLEEMHEGIIEAWNSVVNRSDTVYHLGDLSFLTGKFDQQPLYDILNRLNGQIIMLKGNHDYSNLIDMHVKAIQEKRLRGGIYFENTPYKELRIKKRKIILCHYPIAAWNGQHHKAIHLHGHCHGNLQLPLGRGMDVGYDYLWEAFGMNRPISIDEVLEKLDPVEAIFYDHHGSPRLTGKEAE